MSRYIPLISCLLFIYACVIQIINANIHILNVSFDILFSKYNSCNTYFGSINATKDAINSIERIFASSIEKDKLISNDSISKMKLNGYVEYVNCTISDNTIPLQVSFEINTTNNITLLQHDFSIHLAYELSHHFNDSIALVYIPIITNKSNDVLYYHFSINWLALLMVVPLILILIFGVMIILCVRYKNAYIINKCLVLIVGISQYDDPKKCNDLLDDEENIQKLIKLWRDEYKYDVYVTDKYCTKKDVVNFLDDYNKRLIGKDYTAVIAHIITHGSHHDNFITSDMKSINLGDIHHELAAAEETRGSPLLKIIFYHSCRGTYDYHGDMHQMRGLNILSSKRKDLEYGYQISADFNSVTIYGNLDERATASKGYFTSAICESFTKNASKLIKANFIKLIYEISDNLARKTNGAEICTTAGIGTIRFSEIRFEKCKEKRQKQESLFMLEAKQELICIHNEQEGSNSYGKTALLEEITRIENKDDFDNLEESYNNNSKREEYLDVKHWFINNFTWNEEDKLQYFNLFIENGCHSLHDIASINEEQDLADIGIEEKFHRATILKEIQNLKIRR